MADVYTHHDTNVKFVDFGNDYGNVRLLHLTSGVLRVIPEEMRNWHYACYLKDEMTNASVKFPAGKPSRGLDDLIETIVVEVQEVI